MKQGLIIYLHKESIMYKVIHSINLVLIFASIIMVFVTDKYHLFPIILLYCLSFNIVIATDDSLCISILTIYMQLSGPIQMLVAEISPISVFGPGLLFAKRTLLNSAYLYWQYFFLSTGFYFLLYFFYKVLSHIKGIRAAKFGRINLRIDDMLPNNQLLISIILLAYAFLEYFIRLTFSLNVPGKNPTIAFAGVFVYLISFVHQIIGYMILGSFYKKKRITIGSVLVLVLNYFLLSIPDLMLDRRAPVFFLIIIAFLHMYYKEHEQFVSFIKENSFFFIILIISGLVFFEKFSESVRYFGQVDLPITFFLARITGLADGFVVLDYYNQVGAENYSIFTIPQYFHNVLINGSRSSMCYEYTHTILGFPITAIHSSSLPLYVGSLMYSNILGLVFMSFVFALIFCWTSKLINQYQYGERRSSISLYVGCYLAIYSVSLIMGGGAERLIEIFTLPIMFGVLNIIAEE